MLFKKTKLEFINIIPEAARLQPIEKAGAIPAWFDGLKELFQEVKRSPDYDFTEQIHTIRCPGIFGLIRSGWIMKTWQDMVFETNGDPEFLSWSTPISQAAIGLDNFIGESVHIHPPKQLTKFMGVPASTIKPVLMYNSGWRVRVPKGYYLLEMPVAYSGDFRFTTLSGVFGHEYGYANMNPQFLWHVTNGKEVIRAGTPIAQYVLIKRDGVDFSSRAATPEEFESLRIQHHMMKRSFSKSGGAELRRRGGGDF